jgi:sodium transport system permease protein
MALDLRGAAAIAAGETRSLLRDRQTLLYSILIPFVLYPALCIGAVQVLFIVKGAQERRVARTALLPGAREAGLDARLEKAAKVRVVPAPGSGGAAGDEKVAAWIREGKIDAAIDAAPSGGGLRVDVLYSGARDASASAREKLDAALDGARDEILRERAAAAGGDEGLLDALDIRAFDVTPPRRQLRDVLARLAPLLLVIMAAIGAFYPALDATVGERERSTLETTLILPVGRGALAAGKFIPVAGLAFMAVILNFIGMGIAGWVFFLQFKVGFVPQAPPLSAVAVAAAAAVLLVLLLSGMMLAVALRARSFKEGQSYLGPIRIGAMLPGLAATAPEVILGPAVAAVPVANLALLVRDALLDRLAAVPAAIALGSSALYAAAAVAWAGRLAGRESMLLGRPEAREGRRGPLAWIIDYLRKLSRGARISP